MHQIVKPRSKYHLKLIELVHDENVKDGKKNLDICDATRNKFSKSIKEIASLDKYTTEMNEMLNLFSLRTIYNSIVDIRRVENYCNPDGITERGRQTDDGDIGLIIPEGQYGVLEHLYAISSIPNPVEIGLKGHFDTKDRFVCANVHQKIE